MTNEPIQTNDAVAYLGVHDSSRGLTSDEISQIAECAEVLECHDGDVIHQAGIQVEYLLLVISGRLRVSLKQPGGVEQPIMFQGRGEQFGMLAIMDGAPFPMSVTAEQRAVLLRIPRERTVELLDKYPMWSRNLLRTFAPQIKNTFMGKKRRSRPRFVALIYASSEQRQLTNWVLERLTGFGEQIRVLSDNKTVLKQIPESISLLTSTGEVTPLPEIQSQIARWQTSDRIIIDADLTSATPHMLQIIGACDASFFICSSAHYNTVCTALRPLISKSPGLKEEVFLINILGENEPVAQINTDLFDLSRRDFKLHWNGCGDNSLVRTRQAGLERIIHFLRGVSVGLALGGGAARGMAHLGVLRALEEANITIDCMSGTSAGALTGILYAAGFSPQFLSKAFAADLKPGLMYRMLPYGDAFFMLFKYRLGGWDRMLRRYIHDWKLEQLAVPFSAVAVDLISASPFVSSQGDATGALLESINLPGIARPICRDGKALVDGGVLDVVPADVVVRNGANVVISSDVSAKIPLEFCGNSAETPTESMKVPGTISTVVRTRIVQDRCIRSVGADAADVVIEPDVSQVELTDFKNADKIAELGYAAAQPAILQLRQVLNEMDPQLFPESS